ILHPEDRERVLAENRRTNETGDPFALTYRVLARDGRVVWLQSQAECARDDEGRPRYWHGVAFDVTALREAHEDLARATSPIRGPAEPSGDPL
ncbi:MAG TPA: PAS domain-containing protein, partial [Actinomycetota bacterium]|nr:PAS domain-containing protein [Actinomycetota bacterium]